MQGLAPRLSFPNIQTGHNLEMEQITGLDRMKHMLLYERNILLGSFSTHSYCKADLATIPIALALVQEKA